MSFTIEDFRLPPLDVIWQPEVLKGKELELSLNGDLLTLDKMEALEREFQEVYEELQKQDLALEKGEENEEENKDEDRENNPKTQIAKSSKFEIFFTEKYQLKFRVRMLAGKPGENNPDERYIRSWNVITSEGKPVPVSYDVLIKLGKKTIDDLYEFITTEAGKPTKKKEKR